VYNVSEYGVVLAKVSDSPVERLARGVRYSRSYLHFAFHKADIPSRDKWLLRLFTLAEPCTHPPTLHHLLSHPLFHRHNARQIPDIRRLVGRKVDYSD
jgi:hypothetical protein